MSTLLWSSPRSPPSPDSIHLQYHNHQSMHHRPAHQVTFGASTSPFGSLANAASVPGMPGTLGGARDAGMGFGFGYGYTGQGETSGSGASALMLGKGSKSTMAATTGIPHVSHPQSNSKRRKRRSDSPCDEMLQEDDIDPMLDFREVMGKRVKRDVGSGKQSMLQNTSNGSVHASTASGSDMDAGKALASLSKPALLTMLTTLLTQQPSLVPTILSLLPAPSLDTFTSALLVNEKKVLDALPSGINLRDEYVWSRIRGPLEEYISEARLALNQFSPSPLTSVAMCGPLEDLHPSTVFTFLYTLTLSIRKLELLLPRAPVPFGSSFRSKQSSQDTPVPSVNNPSTLNPRDPLMSFLPSLFNQWHLLVTRLGILVNNNGRVLSAETVRLWFRQLDALIQVSPAFATHVGLSMSPASIGDMHCVGRKASEAVRERFIRELGWLVGVRVGQPASAAASLSMAVGHQQQRYTSGTSEVDVQAAANQIMDSRMMMMDEDGERSDEEL